MESRYSSASRREILNSHVQILVRECSIFFDPLEAMFLHGGYGRGEGTWYRDKEGWHPYNDYDVVVITERRHDQAAVSTLCRALAAMLNLRWVDIVVLDKKRLKKLGHTIFSYDLKYASKLVYGPADIVRLLQPMSAQDLPLREVKRLFVTRLWTFLGCLDRRGLNQELHGQASRFFQNQMAKAVLASADALLLPLGDYHASYRCRVERVLSNRILSPNTRRLFSWALNEKLNATSPSLNRDEVVFLYDAVHTLFFQTMCSALDPYFRTRINSAEDLAVAYRRHWETIVRGVYGFLSRPADPGNLIVRDLAQVYTVVAYQPGGKINERTLTRARKLLKRAYPAFSGSLETWDDARMLAASGRR